MRKIFIVLSVILLLSGCSKTPKEVLFKCIDVACAQDESSEILLNYVEVIATENNTNLIIENYEILPYVISSETKDTVMISFAYSNSQLSYDDGFEELDDVYSLYQLLKSNIMNIETDKYLRLTVGILIEDNMSDYRYLFYTNEEDNVSIFNVDIIAFEHDEEIFMEYLFTKLDYIFSYNEDFKVKVDLHTTSGYYHLISEKGTNEISLKATSSNANADEIFLEEYDTATQTLANDIEEILYNQFAVIILD